MDELKTRVLSRYLPDEEHPTDAAIEEMLRSVKDRILIRIGADELPEKAESIVVDVTVRALRLRGFEGSTSESSADGGSFSNSFIDDVLTGYETDLAMLRASSGGRGFRLL